MKNKKKVKQIITRAKADKKYISDQISSGKPVDKSKLKAIQIIKVKL